MWSVGWVGCNGRIIWRVMLPRALSTPSFELSWTAVNQRWSSGHFFRLTGASRDGETQHHDFAQHSRVAQLTHTLVAAIDNMKQRLYGPVHFSIRILGSVDRPGDYFIGRAALVSFSTNSSIAQNRDQLLCVSVCLSVTDDENQHSLLHQHSALYWIPPSVPRELVWGRGRKHHCHVPRAAALNTVRATSATTKRYEASTVSRLPSRARSSQHPLLDLFNTTDGDEGW